MSFLRRYGRPSVVVDAFTRLCMSCFVPKIQAVKVAVKLRSRRKKVVFGLLIYRRRGYPRFWTCVFKLHLFSTMWPMFVEFRSVTSEGTWRNKRKKKQRRMPVNISPPTIQPLAVILQ